MDSIPASPHPTISQSSATTFVSTVSVASAVREQQFFHVILNVLLTLRARRIGAVTVDAPVASALHPELKRLDERPRDVHVK
eukprot:CAMPEP_0179612474 /NCGR_PEP_ID=MMETSP0930-20121108/4545_1 /TAXON_ID=548131 ORGANISM="Ostreococcus mediterraneus, Strain clade-D-RCC1621" /NCGR_SAMPLE_ID=MMETSP0930 /ASSEMBLY_ACC=CAM_ASM_000580 /LENGTH=81 /DNA_ID=CAMNT_0021481115 /DNA_START=35 /DNA_END=281 /DNA_ORIENTATION=-